MDTSWTPGGGRSKQRSAAAKDPLDDLLGDLLDDDTGSPPKKKSNTNNNTTKQQFSAKKQSSKDEDFYSSLAMAAEDDDLSDVSEADVNKMAKSIADLDDLDADLFQATGGSKTPKRGSLKDKSGKPGTPRRSGTPRSRGGTPRASSPPLRMTSPGNRVLSPTHQRVTSPARGTPTGRDTPGSQQSGIDSNRPGSGSKKSSGRKPASPSTEPTAEYRPTSAPGKMTDLNERASVSLKPGQDQERPKTVPKAKTIDFGDFDADDPLAGIPLSDEEEDFGVPAKKQAQKQVQRQRSSENLSPRASAPATTEPKQESPRQRNLFDRPPTRSGGTKTETSEREQEPAPAQKQPASKPALVKKKSDDALFSDDDDFLGGLGIEEKGAAAKAKVTKQVEEEEENKPAKSVFDKLLGKDTISKHLEPAKGSKEFVLDAKYTKLQATQEADDEYMFGSYMPSAVASSSSRPTSRRSVRFQDDDDIFGLDDVPPSKPTSGKKPVEDTMDWLEMATGGQTPDKPALKQAESKLVQKQADTKRVQKPAEPKPSLKQPETKPSTAPPKSSKADWLGLKSDDEEEATDYLKASSMSAPVRQSQPTAQSQQEKPKVQPEISTKPAGPKASQPASRDDYLGLGEEIDPAKLLRSKTESPKFGRSSDPKDILKDDDIFVSPRPSATGKFEKMSQKTVNISPRFGSAPDPYDVLKEDDLFMSPRSPRPHTGSKHESEDENEPSEEQEDSARKPLFESASRRRQMSPTFRGQSPTRRSPRSPERKEPSPRSKSLLEQLKAVQSLDEQTQVAPSTQPAQTSTLASQTAPLPPASQPGPLPQGETAEDELNSSTDFFSFKKKDSSASAALDQTGFQTTMPLTSSQPDFSAGIGTQSTQIIAGNQSMPMSFAGTQQLQSGIQANSDLMTGSMLANAQQLQQQQQMLQRQQQLRQQQLMKQLQRQQQQFQRQQQQLQQQLLQQQLQQPFMPEAQLFGVGNPLFMDDMSFGLGGQVDLDTQSKIRRLEVELQYARDILTSTKLRYEEEIAAVENSYKNRMNLQQETHSNREKRWREENEQLMAQQLSKIKQMEEEKSEVLSSMYKKLEEAEKEKSLEIERLKEVQRQALENIKKDHEETLVRLRRSKDQQIDAAAASHDTSRSLVAAVELIQNNARDLADLQRKVDNWHAQGLDDREISLRAKDEQLKMLQDRLNKQQEDNEVERHRLQELVARLESQIRDQTRMLEEERWKVKQEQSRLQGLQTALEDERRAWADHQARERSNMEKSREALLEEQRSTLAQLHKERQTLAEEQVQFSMKQKLAKEEGGQYAIKATQAKAEYEALTRAIAEGRDRYESMKETNRNEEDRLQEERRRMEKERSKMESKEAELMEAANMIQEKSREIEDTYAEGQRKYEEGLSALAEAQRIEGEQGKRIDTINHQLNLLKMKEKDMSEERLRLSKEKREMEKFKASLLCPNCRHPARPGGNINLQQGSPQGLLMPANGFQSNGYPEPNGSLPLSQNPALQLTVNTVDAVTEAIKSDRSIRLLRMEALKDQKYLEEQSLYLQTLKYMPHSSPKT